MVKHCDLCGESVYGVVIRMNLELIKLYDGAGNRDEPSAGAQVIVDSK
jgi:hypothetical protein